VGGHWTQIRMLIASPDSGEEWSRNMLAQLIAASDLLEGTLQNASQWVMYRKPKSE
jgi:hypothetical protein